ncbi:hypothetical protein CEXT_324381 [Caerostris extrusa]|uniref:Transposase n=1 Tax=Caerostris extrusa TaxID=172846 RepID=A0AAV4XY43_CAEEX|nr:hypothetical protein CEXT_324381 [Caerostris extrusa]
MSAQGTDAVEVRDFVASLQSNTFSPQDTSFTEVQRAYRSFWTFTPKERWIFIIEDHSTKWIQLFVSAAATAKETRRGINRLYEEWTTKEIWKATYNMENYSTKWIELFALAYTAKEYVVTLIVFMKNGLPRISGRLPPSWKTSPPSG